jgi:hypothetical protein
MHDDDLMALMHEVRLARIGVPYLWLCLIRMTLGSRKKKNYFVDFATSTHRSPALSLGETFQIRGMTQMSPVSYRAIIALSDLLKCCTSLQGGVYLQENKSDITSADAIVTGPVENTSNESIPPDNARTGSVPHTAAILSSSTPVHAPERQPDKPSHWKSLIKRLEETRTTRYAPKLHIYIYQKLILTPRFTRSLASPRLHLIPRWEIA